MLLYCSAIRNFFYTLYTNKAETETSFDENREEKKKQNSSNILSIFSRACNDGGEWENATEASSVGSSGVLKH